MALHRGALPWPYLRTTALCRHNPRHISNRASTQNLKKRVRHHYGGNAAGSTIRLTIGCLLGLELRRVDSRSRGTTPRSTGEA
ncbi:GIY-YIG nuclease family protein [Streptomyces cucumeris]|uniref:GIY-YIG nuclease family protein n=1 Tax=Streptomyces cucumeris TaxID=2962890 RepID=UPI003EBA5729